MEKNIYEIKNEINNISSGIKLFLDKDYFLYNFKDDIRKNKENEILKIQVEEQEKIYKEEI